MATARPPSSPAAVTFRNARPAHHHPVIDDGVEINTPTSSYDIVVNGTLTATGAFFSGGSTDIRIQQAGGTISIGDPHLPITNKFPSSSHMLNLPLLE